MVFFAIVYWIAAWVMSIYWGFTWGFAANREIGWQVVWSIVATLFIRVLFWGVGAIVRTIVNDNSESEYERTLRRIGNSGYTPSSMSTRQALENLERRYKTKPGALNGMTPERRTRPARTVDEEKQQLKDNIRTARPLPPPE